MRARFEQSNNTGVLELSCGRGLGLEAQAVVGVGQLAAEDHLQGDDAAQAHMPRLVNNAHAAAADLLQEFVFIQAIERQVRRARQRAGLLAQFAGQMRVQVRPVGARTRGAATLVDGRVFCRFFRTRARAGVVGGRVAHARASLCTSASMYSV